MSKIDLSVGELFLKLGATPVSRSAKASSLFRRLRDEDSREIDKALLKGPSRLVLGRKAATDNEATDEGDDTAD